MMSTSSQLPEVNFSSGAQPNRTWKIRTEEFPYSSESTKCQPKKSATLKSMVTAKRRRNAMIIILRKFAKKEAVKYQNVFTDILNLANSMSLETVDSKKLVNMTIPKMLMNLMKESLNLKIKFWDSEIWMNNKQMQFFSKWKIISSWN